MKKYILLLLVGFFYFPMDAQVRINVTNPTDEQASADFQVYSTDKGFALPQITLTNLTTYAPVESTPIDGLMIYNIGTTVEKGVYYWMNNQWNRLGKKDIINNTIQQSVDTSFLGYDLKPYDAATTAVPTGLTLTGCAKWESKDGGNGHTYCGYTTSTARTFAEVTTLASQLGAYPVTIVSQVEWDFVNTNIIKMNVTPLNQAIWIGYARVLQSGNRYAKYMWMTGENSLYQWSNVPTTYHNFIANQPTLNTTTNKDTKQCAFIMTAAANVNRQWSSSTCDVKTSQINYIFEFNP